MWPAARVLRPAGSKRTPSQCGVIVVSLYAFAAEKVGVRCFSPLALDGKYNRKFSSCSCPTVRCLLNGPISRNMFLERVPFLPSLPFPPPSEAPDRRYCLNCGRRVGFLFWPRGVLQMFAGTSTILGRGRRCGGLVARRARMNPALCECLLWGSRYKAMLKILAFIFSIQGSLVRSYV